MQKIFLVFLLAVFLFGALSASAQDNPSVSSGLLPDSHFYFLKAWKEKIQLFFTFNAENKIKQLLHLSEVRLAEYQKMVEKGKDEIAQKTLEKYEHQLSQAVDRVEQLKQKGENFGDIAQGFASTTERNIEILTQNLTKVPEPAKQAIERVIETAQQRGENLKQLVEESAAGEVKKTSGQAVEEEFAGEPASGLGQGGATSSTGLAPQQGPVQGPIVSTPPSQPVCQPGLKCKDNIHQAYQQADCSWKEEIFCQFNCQNNKCQEDPCKNIKCPDSCDGKTRKYNGACANGQCKYETLSCGFGCENGVCKGDPCLGVKCSGLCEGNTRKFDGKCVEGKCVFSSQGQCQYGCLDGECKANACLNINCPDKCDGDARKYNGQCVDGACQYSSSQCNFGCEAGVCKASPCLNVFCPTQCDGKIKKYDGQCVQGVCQYKALACDYACADGNCVQDPCAGVDCPVICDGAIRKYDGLCQNGQCQYSSEPCFFGCEAGACKQVDSFACNYVWYQEILNAKTSEFILKCPSLRPFCRAGFFQCCSYDATAKEHYNCADCLSGNCQNTGLCASVTCRAYCENGKRYYHGVCKNGVCQYETEDAKLPCVGGFYVSSGVIFVTDASLSPNLGGISGADAVCQSEASSAGLPGVWIALLSTANINAKDRIPDVAFYNLGGVLLANNKAELFDGSLLNGVYYTATKQVKQYSTWTGTNTAGTAQGSDHCNSWTYYGGSKYGAMGNSGRSDNEWIWRSLSRYTCGNYAHIYCVLIP